MLVERSLGGRNPTTQVQGSRVTWRADGRRTTLCPRGLEGSLGSKCLTTASRSCYHLSRRHRGLLGRPSGPRPIHAAVGGPLLGHLGIDFSEAGRDFGHAEERAEERIPSHAATEPRARLRRASEADARAKDLSHIPRLLRRYARDKEAQARFKQLQEMLPRGEWI